MNFLSFNIRGIGGAEKPGWLKKVKSDFGIHFLSLHETKKQGVSVLDVSGYWGNKSFSLESVDAEGLSGGLVCMWDKSVFSQTGVNRNRNFLHVRGKLSGSSEVVNVLNVCAHQGVSAKKSLWDMISQLIAEHDGFWIVSGDFNAVRYSEEKKNCGFKQNCANNFNSFIFDSGLLEYNLIGRKFTYSKENGRKMSKLDRFLVNHSFF
ncbi:uncharacterized protein LOC110943769 [Helianthus annuus]|uniref:uncharacterized protein LOC110943769 n=1 Tax=Helianthus annuus TaxID=4232 RepID=UPI000B903610|nr:uncharacterized protein LOC110943769 [Helianthus annuus]